MTDEQCKAIIMAILETGRARLTIPTSGTLAEHASQYMCAAGIPESRPPDSEGPVR